MGFFDFLKKKKKEPVSDTKRISISQVSDFIKDISSKNNKEKHEIYLTIRTKLNFLIIELKEKIKNISQLNLKEKKVEDRVKFIVKENLDRYLLQLEKFIKDLKEIKSENFDEYVKNIDDIFYDFNKKSKLNYEKATFIIGKELGQIKEAIDDFFKEMKNILNKNNNIIEESKTIVFLGEKNSEIINISNNEFQIKEKIKKVNENINKNNISIDIKESEIKEIKKSIEYVNELKLTEDKDKTYKEIENLIFELKQLIDFKKLANMYHNLPKTMEIINKYKNNFKNNFLKDNGIEILELIEEARLTDAHISKQVTIISNTDKIYKEKYNKLRFPKKEKINELSETIKNLKNEIDNLNSDKSREDKKLNKAVESKNQIINEIKTKLQELNAGLYE